MSDLRVLVVTFEFLPFSGGIATYTDSVAGGLSGSGCDVTVLAPHYPGCEEGDAGRSYRTTRMGVGHGRGELFRFLPGYRALRAQLARSRPDVALLTSDLAHGLGGVVCPRSGVPFIPVVHGSEIAKHFPPQTSKQRLQALWLASAYRKAAGVLCVSEYVRGLMVAGGFSPEKLRVIHNGIPERFLSEPEDAARIQALRRSLKVEGRRVILTLARLTPRKGQAEMIRAMPSILRRHPDARYVIAGQGEAENRLRRLARGLGLGEEVIFAGAIPEEEKVPVLDLCDLYALPSRREAQRVEGLGIALLEAGARGKPLVAGRHGGIPEIISHGRNGLLVDAAQPPELARAACALLDDPELAESLGRAARATVAEGFLESGMARASLDAIREILAGGDSGASPGPRASSPISYLHERRE